MRRLIILLITLLSTLFSEAQPSGTVRTFTVNDGLPSNAITVISQDCHSLIWIATWNGLCCYDGYRFTTFHGDGWGSDNALTTQRIAGIEPDSQGNIWVRTYDARLYLFDTRQCRYVNVGLLIERKYGKKIQPRNIYCMPSGHTWIRDENATLNIRIDDRYPTDVDKMEVISPEDFPLQTVAAEKNRREEGKWEQAETYIAEHNVGKHLIDRQGNLWFISPQGLSLVNFRQCPIRLLSTDDPSTGSGQYSSQTRSVVYRNDGTLWAGARNGTLAVFNSDGQLVSRKTFLQNLYAMHEDRQGNLWIGTRGDGLFIIDAKGQTIGHYTHSDAPYSISHNDIYDIEEDKQGNIWIATWGGGVNIVKREERRAESNGLRFIHKGNEMTGYPKKGFDKVRRITHDSHGTMIASTTWGLLTFASPNNSTPRIYTTRQVANDTTSLRANDVMQVLVCRSGAVYVATMGGGIQQIMSEDLLQDSLRLQTVREMNQGRGNALSMTEDLNDNIWIVREAQINCYNVKTGHLEQFGPNSMSEQTELTEAKPAIDGKGNIWLGAVGGVMTFNVGQMSKSDFRPNIMFTGIRFQGEQQERPVLNQQTLYITDKERRNLTIAFAALDYGDNYLTQYAYRLKETDKDWNYIGRDPHIAFSQLSPGRHTLIVKSTNCDGVWMDNDTEIVIDIEPMLWERTWVRLLVLLLVIGLSTWAVIAWISHRRKVKEREQRMERILQQYGDLNENDNLNLNDNQNENNGSTSSPLINEKPKHQYKLAEPTIVDEDETMMNHLMAFLENHIGDDSLRIEDMAEAVGLSRTVFYERIRNLMGVSPSDFLRQLRMQRACQLVAASKLSFSQIAYSVGFADPKYFTKCFKKYTGMTPSEYRAAEPTVSSIDIT